MASKIVMDGYTLPEGVWVKTDVKEMQKELGVKVDGIWGPKTQAAYDKYTYERGPTASLAYPGLSLPLGVDTTAGVKAVQKQLGTYDTGLWNYDSQNKYDKYLVRRLPQNFEVGKYPILTPAQTYQFDLNAYNWGIGRSDKGDHVMSGYTTPDGADDHDGVKKWQQVLGVTQDGIWGPRTQDAYDRLLEMGVQAMQTNTQTSGTNTQQSSGQAPWQNMVYTEKQGGSNPSISNNVMNGQDAPIAARQALNASTKEQTPQQVLWQLQWEREHQLGVIRDLPAWEKTSILGAAPSERYIDAMQRIREIDKEISKEMKRVGDTMSFETKSTPMATSSPTPSPTPAPSPTPTPQPTPSSTPNNKITDFSVPAYPEFKKNRKGEDVWKGKEGLWNEIWAGTSKELGQCSSDDGGLTAAQRTAIVLYAAGQIGKPYGKDEEGNKVEGGIDCSKLVQNAYKAAGVELPRTSRDIAKSANNQSIAKEDLKPGDLIFWKTGDTVTHVGLYLFTDSKGTRWVLDSTPSEAGPNIQEEWNDPRENGARVSGYAAYRKP